MVKLSDRLKCIADEIKQGEAMADIGCDHGFLPMYLWENKIASKVIMIDISESSLEKGKTNFLTECLIDAEEKSSYYFRVGNGIEPLKKKEVNKVVIAGMGGILIANIIQDSIDKARCLDGLILQPRNNIAYLRKWLYNNDFKIVKEKLVREGKFICTILVVKYEEGCADDFDYEYPAIYKIGYKDVYYEAGESYCNLEASDELLYEYLHERLNKETYILNKILSAKAIDKNSQMLQQKKIERLEYLIGKR